MKNVTVNVLSEIINFAVAMGLGLISGLPLGVAISFGFALYIISGIISYVIWHVVIPWSVRKYSAWVDQKHG